MKSILGVVPCLSGPSIQACIVMDFKKPGQVVRQGGFVLFGDVEWENLDVDDPPRERFSNEFSACKAHGASEQELPLFWVEADPFFDRRE
jgi:hypothetical protein